jgi:hypothetical protein
MNLDHSISQASVCQKEVDNEMGKNMRGDKNAG